MKEGQSGWCAAAIAASAKAAVEAARALQVLDFVRARFSRRCYNTVKNTASGTPIHRYMTTSDRHRGGLIGPAAGRDPGLGAENSSTHFNWQAVELAGSRCPEPEFHADSFFTVVFRPLPAAVKAGTKLALSRHQVQVLRECSQEQSLVDLLTVLGRTDRTKFRKQVLGPLLEAGFVEMTSPDKPRSSKQRYRITPLGREILSREDVTTK